MQRLRKKILRFNNNTFMTKALKKVIIHRNFNNTYKFLAIKSKRIYVYIFFRKLNKYFQKLHVKHLLDNEKFVDIHFSNLIKI